MKKNSKKAEMLMRCKCIIWDECTMAHKNSLWGVDLTLRDIRSKPNDLFGGIVVVLSGDFRQTLPVIESNYPPDVLNACLKQSHLWSSVRRYNLSTNMRVQLRGEEGAAEFADKILMIGEGRCPFDNRGLMPITDDICRPVQTREALIDAVFPNLEENLVIRTWQGSRAILCPHNESVEEMNKLIQDRMTSTESRFYFSYDTNVDPEESVNYPVEFLNSLTPAGFPPHELALKIDSTIMVLRNLRPPMVVNGTRMRVTRLDNNIITGIILAGPYQGEEVFIPRIKLRSDELFSFERCQFPVRLAFAMTVNKSQGQTLGTVGIDLTESCFSHGQLYVAFSRSGSPSNMFVYAPNNHTKNIVYPMALA